jgi:diguanylate cyclase (GGDEF)-like protein
MLFKIDHINYSFLSIKNKIYFTLSIIGIFFSISATLINIIFDLGNIQILISTTIGIISICFFYASQNKTLSKKIPIITFIIIVTFLYPLFWITSAGINGYIPYLYILNSFLIATLLKKKESILIFFLQFISFMSLIYIEITYPDIIIKYTSEAMRISDITITFFMIILFVFIAQRKIMNEYTKIIKELETTKEKLKIISNTDELSGIFNRRYLIDQLKHNIQDNPNSNISLIMFDIDNFKMINDIYGHSIGDEVIKKISLTLTDNTRIEDIVGRIGGEEFLIILNNFNYDETKSKAEYLRKLVSNLKWPYGNLKVTISGGVYLRKNNETIEEILKKVDVYLYKSKREGKNKIN